VVADSSGIVMIPGGLADRVVALAQRIIAAEAGMLRRIRAGEPVSQVLSAAYEDMLEPGS
jgi:regulator of RNase E activity RraA